MNRSVRSPQPDVASGVVTETTASASDAFADGVMAAVAGAPPPTPTRTFLWAVRVHATRSAAATLWVAWHLATVRGWRVAPQVRARSLALILGVASVLGTGSLAAAAAVHVVAPRLVVIAPAANPTGAPADDPRVVVRDPSETAGPGRTNDATPSPIVVVAPVVSVPRATPNRTETGRDSVGAKRPPAAHDDADDGSGDGATTTHAGDDRSDDREPPSATHDGGDDSASDQPDKTDGGDGGSDGGDRGGTEHEQGSGG